MLQKRLRTFNHGSSTSSSIFPATLPVPITTFNQLMEDGGSFVFSPKPLGIRYLFYFDKEGRSFLMNSTQHIFKVAKSCAFRVIPPETVLDGIVVRKIVRSERSNQEASNGKLTFVIMDATRINGVDLTQKSIQERMSIVQVLKLFNNELLIFWIQFAQNFSVGSNYATPSTRHHEEDHSRRP